MLSYAGVPLVEPSAELAGWISARIPAERAFGFFRPARLSRAALDPRAHFAWFLNRPVEVGTFVNPWGAARWGYCFALADGAMYQALASASGTAQPLTISDGVASSVTTNLHLLPAVPLAQIAAAPALPLYLLPLVDARYFWWERAAKIEVEEGVTTWAELYAALATALNIALTCDPVSSDYLKPAHCLGAPYDYLPMLLDWVAASVGQRIARGLDGNVYARNAFTGQALALAQKDLYARVAGGQYDFSSLPADVPFQVAVRFPRALDHRESFVVTVAGSGRSGQKLIHSSALARGLPQSPPSNASELTLLGQKIGTDFYAWRALGLEARYAGPVPWTPDGIHDVEVRHNAAGITTAVHRAEWEPPFGKLLHAGEAGSDRDCECPPPAARMVRIEAIYGRFCLATLLVWDPEATVLVARDGQYGLGGPCWAEDFATASTAEVGGYYPAVLAGTSGGVYWIATEDNDGDAPEESSAWFPITGSGTAAAWDNTTRYVPGDLVTSDSNKYLCFSENVNKEPPNAGYWLLLPTVNSMGEWDEDTEYLVGDLVTRTLDAYSFRSDEYLEIGLPTHVLTITTGTPLGATGYYDGHILGGGQKVWARDLDTSNDPQPGQYLAVRQGTVDGDPVVCVATTSSEPLGSGWRLPNNYATYSAWSSGASYAVNDLVTGGAGAIYLATAASGPGDPKEPPNSSYWQLLPDGLNDQGEWLDGEEYAVGDVVLHPRPLYDFRSDEADIRSINGQTGPEVTFGSADGSVTVNASGNQVDLSVYDEYITHVNLQHGPAITLQSDDGSVQITTYATNILNFRAFPGHTFSVGLDPPPPPPFVPAGGLWVQTISATEVRIHLPYANGAAVAGQVSTTTQWFGGDKVFDALLSNILIVGGLIGADIDAGDLSTSGNFRVNLAGDVLSKTSIAARVSLAVGAGVDSGGRHLLIYGPGAAGAGSTIMENFVEVGTPANIDPDDPSPQDPPGTSIRFGMIGIDGGGGLRPPSAHATGLVIRSDELWASYSIECHTMESITGAGSSPGAIGTWSLDDDGYVTFDKLGQTICGGLVCSLSNGVPVTSIIGDLADFGKVPVLQDDGSFAAGGIDGGTFT